MGLLSSVNLGVARAWPRLKALRSSSSRRSILAELQHADNAPIHPLWTYLPREQRSRGPCPAAPAPHLGLAQTEATAHWPGGDSLPAIWSIPLLVGEHLLTAFALLPLVLVPPVGYLVYWLVWKEFHN